MIERTASMKGSLKFFLVFFGAYSGTALLAVLCILLLGKWSVYLLGNDLLIAGIAAFILGFLLIAAPSRWGDVLRSPRFHSDETFMSWRKEERPVERVAWAVILAGVLLVGTGYLIMLITHPI